MRNPRCLIGHANGLVVPSRTESRRTIHRITYNTKCDCHGICQKCHAPDGPYPAAQVAADRAALRASGDRFIHLDNSVSISLRGSLCNCACVNCFPETDNRVSPPTVADCPSIEQPILNAESPISNESVVGANPPKKPAGEPTYEEVVLADFLRQQRLLKTRRQ